MELQSNTNPDLARFLTMLAEDTPLTAADLPMVDGILRSYPYFTLAAATMAETEGLSADERSRLKSYVALNAPDSESLMKLIDADGRRWGVFYPEDPGRETPDTDSAIDTFLDQYGDIDPQEKRLLERLIFNPVPDYSQVLAAEEPAPEGEISEQDAMLDAFLAGQNAATMPMHRPAAHRAPRPEAAKAEADAPLSESLAKIYLQQGRYDKAYEIIYQLSLNFPKKSIYFADQLRFLKKAMLID